MHLTLYVDNQPDYLTSNPPPLRHMLFEILAKGRLIHTDEDDYCEPTKRTFLVEIREANGVVRDFKQLLSRALSPAPCYCEHDCCGHLHGYADVRLFDFDRAEVTVYTMRNF